MLQYNDPDRSTKLPLKLPEGFLLSDEEYETGQKKPAPARAMQEPTSGEPDSPPGTKEKENKGDSERRKSRQQNSSFLQIPKV